MNDTSITEIVGWLLYGIWGIESFDDYPELDFAASWAQGPGRFWVYFAAVAVAVLAISFYLQLQKKGTKPFRLTLGLCRGLLLALLVFTLADPIFRLSITRQHRPHVYVVIDGTDSMAIADEYEESERKALWQSAGYSSAASPGTLPKSEPTPISTSVAQPTRMELVQSLLQKDKNLLSRLESKAQVDVFIFDGATTSQLRKIPSAEGSGDKLDPAFIARQLTTKGQVTAVGSVLRESLQQVGSGNLAGVVLVSDFSNNSGPAPKGDPFRERGVLLYTVGVGATETVDLAVDVQTDPRMKKAERSAVTVKLRQSGLGGRQASVKLIGRRLSSDSMMPGEFEFTVGEKNVDLNEGVSTVDFPYTPEEAGRVEFVAEVQPLDGETVTENNRFAREVNIIDDYLRLMYVAYEPTWEWRFIKEVFHRDKLVGMQGFRTFLGSSDPRVRENNVLFLPTLTPKRSEFFANDVIFLDDLPQSALNDRFGDMVKEFVGNLGGGLVVISGSRFGPKELVGTPLADMLPVIVDPQQNVRDDRDFRPQLTPHAPRYQFMELGQTPQESAMAWENMGRLQWYQPVAALHEQAFSLMDHPTDKCADGKTPQPLIAVRPYGRGEVIYLGFNETWRLRRKYGEKYYRQFWSQMIYRLGMSHALGNEKRFVVRLDQQQYRVEDKATLTIEGFTEQYEPLTEENLADKTLTAELTLPATASTSSETRLINVPLLKPGVFEARIPVFAAGEYTLRVKDPVTSKYEERRFEVTELSAERRQGVRNEKLQNDLAQATGGKSYDLTTVDKLADDLRLEPIPESLTRTHPLWATPLWFGSVVLLMLGEWFTRKMNKLS